MKTLYELPDNLPVPIDDGACAHLQGMRLPPVSLSNTIDQKVNISAISGIAIFYFYPMTGRPDSLPMIGWNEIPGARGCTPQSCSFRDHYSELRELGADVFGISSQPLEEQK
nr:redoxin domain-containing protein [Betaproteobacteria bacterium]